MDSVLENRATIERTSSRLYSTMSRYIYGADVIRLSFVRSMSNTKVSIRMFGLVLLLLLVAINKQ